MSARKACLSANMLPWPGTLSAHRCVQTALLSPHTHAQATVYSSTSVCPLHTTPLLCSVRSLLGTLASSALDRRKSEEALGSGREESAHPACPATSHRVMPGNQRALRMSRNWVGSVQAWTEVPLCHLHLLPLLLGCWNKATSPTPH